MKVFTKMLEDELYESFSEDNNAVQIDMRSVNHKKHQSPVEILLSAVAACSAVDIVTILKKRKKTITEFTIETDGTRRTETPRAFTAIHCKFSMRSPDITEDELMKAAKLSVEKYCSVAASLKAPLSISVEVKP